MGTLTSSECYRIYCFHYGLNQPSWKIHGIAWINFNCFTIDESDQVKISREIMRCEGYFFKIALGTRVRKFSSLTKFSNKCCCMHAWPFWKCFSVYFVVIPCKTKFVWRFSYMLKHALVTSKEVCYPLIIAVKFMVSFILLLSYCTRKCFFL